MEIKILPYPRDRRLFLFVLETPLAKKEICEKCLGAMKETSKRWEPDEGIQISGYDIIFYTCQKCGYIYKEAIAHYV